MIGFWPKLRARLFGERDLVAEQLRDIARQGSGMARVAHLCASMLIILFSAGSLVALSGEALTNIISQWRAGAGVNIPDAISVAVSTLMVVAMDVAMVYAASVLRVMGARRAEASEKRPHYAVMAIVALLEAGTYTYMSQVYQRPTSLVAWALILARAGAAPLLAVYLSMARPLPVTSRDILAQAELASGMGVLRDVVSVTNDANASLARKMRLYKASAVMTTQDQTRLDGMIAAMQDDEHSGAPVMASNDQASAAGQRDGARDTSLREAQSPIVTEAASEIGEPPEDEPPPLPPTPQPGRRRATTKTASNGHIEHVNGASTLTLLPLRTQPEDFPPSAQSSLQRRRILASSAGRKSSTFGKGKSSPSAKSAQRKAQEIAAFALLDSDPSMTKVALRRALKVRQTTADGLYVAWQNTHREARRYHTHQVP